MDNQGQLQLKEVGWHLKKKLLKNIIESKKPKTSRHVIFIHSHSQFTFSSKLGFKLGLRTKATDGRFYNFYT